MENVSWALALNSNSAGNRGANTLVLSSAAGQIKSNEYVITHGENDDSKIKMCYNSTLQAMEFIFNPTEGA
jgi:hypothetical protein